jgi:hypothetical protein
MKKIIIPALLLICFLGVPKDSFAQEQKEPAIAKIPDVPDDVVRLDPAKLPPKTREVFEASVVDVVFYSQSYTHPNRRNLSENGMGVVVADHFVLTCYHLTDTLRKNDPRFDPSGAIADVSDGGVRYPATIVDFNEKEDLLLLKIGDVVDHPFTKQPAALLPFASESLSETVFSFNRPKNQKNINRVLPMLYVRHIHLMRMGIDITTVAKTVGGGWAVDRKIKSITTISGKAREGSSGSPMIDENGFCRGLARGILFASHETFFIPVASIERFLEHNGVRHSVARETMNSPL